MDGQKQPGILHVPCTIVTIKMSTIHHSHRYQLIAKGWLTVLVSLMTFSCTDASNSSIESAISETSPVAEAATDCETALSAKLDGVSPEKAKQAAEAVEAARDTPCEEAFWGFNALLQAAVPEGMHSGGVPYTEARADLIAQGWVPSSSEHVARRLDWNDPRVQQMQAQGFDEIQSCSPEDNSCLFTFVYTDRVLTAGGVMSAYVEFSEDGEPRLWDLLSTNSVTTTYGNQQLSATILSELIQQAQDSSRCGVTCAYRNESFKDAQLISIPYDFGAANVSLYLSEPIDKETALSYAQILDAQAKIDFDSVEREQNREMYANCAIEFNRGRDAQFLVLYTATLVLTPDDTVSQISFDRSEPQNYSETVTECR